MKSSTPVNYDFIPDSNKYDSGTGFCVIDEFVGTYGYPLIKKLTHKYFIDLCYKVRVRKKSEAHLQAGSPWVVLTRPPHSNSLVFTALNHHAEDLREVYLVC